MILRNYFIALLILVSGSASAQLAGQECFPDKKVKLVYDEADVLSDSEEQTLERNLENFDDSTSNQIVVVIVPDLCGMDKAQFATELGEAWGVGHLKEDNGIVVLVKPKTATSNGQLFIAPGRGLESVIPDATAKLIVDEEMIPRFKQNDYYGGITDGVRVLEELARGEYNSGQYASSKKPSNAGGVVIFISVLLFVCVFLFFRYVQAKRYARINNIAFWAAWALLNNAGRRHSGTWSDFSGGRGHFGGWGGGGSGGGGFGGFGGGSFGGGGSGGSW